MEQDAPTNFKSLRAKFQESKAKDRPPVPERPKRLPSTVVRYGPQPSFIRSITPVEDQTPVCSKATLRHDHKLPVSLPVHTLQTTTLRHDHKLPVSLPVHTLQTTTLRHDHKLPVSLPVHTLQTTTNPATGSTHNQISKAAFKHRHLPLVLPIPFSGELKLHSVSPPNGVSSPVRGKKKPMIMPFKSIVTSRFGKGPLENGEHTISVEKSKAVNGFYTNGESFNPGSVSPSPEKNATSPPADGMEGSSTEGCASQTSHQRVLSTLEKAKRKFSPKQLLEYAKPKSFHSRNSSPSASPPPPPVDYENMITEPEPPVPLPKSIPHTIPLHAPPTPLKSNGVCLNYATVSRNKGSHLDLSAQAPPVKMLPDLQSLGPKPVKPPRPPLVDLKPFSTSNEFEQNGLLTARASASSREVHLDHHVLEAPVFPDFDHSEPENLDHNAFAVANVDMPPVPTGTLGEGELPPPDLVHLNCKSSSVPSTCGQVASETPEPPALPHHADTQPVPVPETDGAEEINSDCVLSSTPATDSIVTSELASEQSPSFYEHCDNIYEDVAPATKFPFSQNSRKHKGTPKNPYATPPVNELTRKTVRSITAWTKETGEHITLTRRNSGRKERGSPETHEKKEQRKKEKQHLEKEKKEQKERQKRENDMKKKFKVTGLEEPMYIAKVLVDSKVRKHDLPVKSGDTVSIIRITSCPKGKWLARDATHRYGYVSLKSLELNIKEMLELGKKPSQTAGLAANEGDTVSLGSSTPNPTHNSSFSDDSEEWTFDEETLSPTTDMPACRSMSMPEMFGSDCSTHQTQLDDTVNGVTAQTRHEALQKLAIFFQQSRGSFDDTTDNGGATPTNTDNTDLLCAVEEHLQQQGEDFDLSDVAFLPPPELYADTL
ncbi:FYN-binding protein 1 isoform X2 [Clupea harengus]|uniref:FYN-binding protein 1 isoform X2 n=1 Tax=Clupea harengus TaxID=7950 RepID=A0A8M1KA50_CLUHA|nr:FYN-binding protein 1 isoform X2 [Clupea harengus]